MYLFMEHVETEGWGFNVTWQGLVSCIWGSSVSELGDLSSEIFRKVGIEDFGVKPFFFFFET